jgi:hypothetical protein
MRGHCSRSRKRPSGKPSGRAIALDDGRGPKASFPPVAYYAIVVR